MSGFQVGLKAIKSMVATGDAFSFYKAKLTEQLFVTDTEKQAFAFVTKHMKEFQCLPALVSLETEFPEFKEVDTPEPSTYYVAKVEERFEYNVLSQAALDTHEALQKDPQATKEIRNRLLETLNTLSQQEYRHRIMDLGVEGPKAVMQAYYNLIENGSMPALFGWPHLDDRGGLPPGEMAAIVGRPGMGKTYLLLHAMLTNWVNGRNVLMVTTEMANLAIAQRSLAMYAHTPVDQLKIGQYSTQTLTSFKAGMKNLQKEPNKMYLLDANSGIFVDDIYMIAHQLKADVVGIDGAYLVRHPNLRLDKYTRIADNAEKMKQRTGEIGRPTIATWQLNREATKKDKSKGQRVSVDDIGGSDVIGQICSIVLALLQEDGVETLMSRLVDLLKGRGGETGQFRVLWDFINMVFTQMDIKAKADEELTYL